MDVRSTGIIGRASAVRINYQKWVGPSIDTIDPSHSEFQVWCSAVSPAKGREIQLSSASREELNCVRKDTSLSPVLRYFKGRAWGRS